MGGQGSGRRPDSMRSTTSSRRELNINRLRRSGLLNQDSCISWGWQNEGQATANIDIYHMSGILELSYRIKLPQTGWQERSYTVDLAHTPNHFGGQRAWFSCPAPGCGKRVASLFLNGQGYFTCRHCQNLTYASQHESPAFRLMSRADKIRRKLGWEPGIANANGDKPKGMHFRTFPRLTQRHDQIVHAAFKSMLEKGKPARKILF